MSLTGCLALKLPRLASRVVSEEGCGLNRTHSAQKSSPVPSTRICGATTECLMCIWRAVPFGPSADMRTGYPTRHPRADSGLDGTPPTLFLQPGDYLHICPLERVDFRLPFAGWYSYWQSESRIAYDDDVERNQDTLKWRAPGIFRL